MSDFYDAPFASGHDHVFLGAGHEKNERKTWAVIVLCALMMAVEIIGGSVFGSLALVADGLPADAVAQVVRLLRLAEYKRQQGPVGPRVTARAFGRDWRYPITSAFREPVSGQGA